MIDQHVDEGDLTSNEAESSRMIHGVIRSIAPMWSDENPRTLTYWDLGPSPQRDYRIIIKILLKFFLL